MSAQLFFSNSPAVLLDKLSQNLEWSDPFLSPHIATPTPAMKRWVQMRLAEKRGIVANVDFLQLERTLWQRLELLDQEHVVAFRKPARLLDEKNLQLLILALLRRSPPEEAQGYLDAGKGGALHARRLFQLSAKLAGFFREYEYSRVQEHGRKGLAYLWKHGEDCFREYLDAGATKAIRAQVEELERWQKGIYHELFRTGGIRDQLGESQGQYQYTLPQYAEMVLAQKRAPAAPGTDAPDLHLFGLSQISPFHRSLIRRLSDAAGLRGHHSRFFIYSLNPCAEYWEDALNRQERRRVRQEDLFRRRKYVEWHQLDAAEKRKLTLEMEKIQEEELHLKEENPILSQWGRPGRENVQLWNQVPDYDFFSHFQERAGKGLLGVVQDSVLKRLGRLDPHERTVQDDSLQILACPEIHREVETARQAIVEDLLRDPTLRPDEIAVLVPDMAKYRHVLAAVFGGSLEGEPGHVPFSFGDTSISAESEYARAVRALFDLARGRFSRKDLFALANNPCFRQGLGLDEDALKVWVRWTERLNIFHGFDGEDRKHRGYPEDGSHTWAHGLERLLLGTIMESPLADDARHFDGIVPFADGNSPDRETLQAFLLVVEKLHLGLGPLRKGDRKPWREWLDLFARLWDEYLSVPGEDSLEAFVREDLQRYLRELRCMDGLEALFGAEDPVPSEIPMDLVLGHLEGLKAGRDSNFSGGVNIASLQALRSLPFRIVHILGLGEGEFPEDASTSTLDLRQYRRVIGDVEPAARNRYLFLEALVGTAEKLRLSYLCRDVRLGKAFQMSSVLNELIDYLEDGILAGEDGGPARFRQVQVPLLSRSPELFAAGARRPWDPPRNHNREERLLGWIESKKNAWTAESLRAHLPAALKHQIFPEPPPAITVPAREITRHAPPEKIPLEDLRGYLENPVQSSLKRYLGIRDFREEEAMNLEDEPFACPPKCDRELLDRVIRERLADWRDPSGEAALQAFDELYEDMVRRGMMPAGHYRTLDKENQRAKAASALGAVGGVMAALSEDGAPDLKLGLDLGDGDRRNRAGTGLSFPPVRIQAAGKTIELHGHLQNLFVLPGGAGCSTLVVTSGSKKPDRFLSPFLFYLAGLQSDSALGEWLRSGKFAIRGIYHTDDGYASWNWAPFEVSPAEARRYLEGLLADLLAGPDFDLLPFGAIAKCLVESQTLFRLKPDPGYAHLLREELEEGDGREYASYRPTRTVRILEPRVPEDAYAKVQARLGLFFNWK